jgi:hypothetical protein
MPVASASARIGRKRVKGSENGTVPAISRTDSSRAPRGTAALTRTLAPSPGRPVFHRFLNEDPGTIPPVASLVQGIEERAAAERERTGKPVLGVKAILAEDPLHRPAHLDRSPAPLFHVATKAMWQTLYEAYAWFVAAFRDASEKLRAGDRTVRFPAGSFPPALPFVPG